MLSTHVLAAGDPHKSPSPASIGSPRQSRVLYEPLPQFILGWKGKEGGKAPVRTYSVGVFFKRILAVVGYVFAAGLRKALLKREKSAVHFSSAIPEHLVPCSLFEKG